MFTAVSSDIFREVPDRVQIDTTQKRQKTTENQNAMGRQPSLSRTDVTTNHKPVVKGGDLGIWRRLHPLRFGVKIPRARRLEPEMPGILNWALTGLAAYLKDGLKEPKAVKAERAAYREEMDLVGQWVDAQCVKAAGAKTGATTLYRDYAEWSHNETGIVMKQA